MRSSRDILNAGRFRPNRLMKAQLWEDQQDAAEGKLGMTEAQKEQVAQESANAAAAQAAQTQTEISRSMVGQPDFVGQKAALSAAASEGAAAQAGAGRAAASQMSQPLALQRKSMIDQRLAVLTNRRYNTGMWAAQTGINAGAALAMGVAGGPAAAAKTMQNPVAAPPPVAG